MEKNGLDTDFRLYDVIKIHKFKITKSADRYILVLKDTFEKVKTGLKSKIGSPRLVEDFIKSGDWPKSSIQNTYIPLKGAAEVKEEVKNGDSPLRARKTGTCSKTIDDSYTPISALTTMNSEGIIQAKVTQKGDLRTYRNVKGEGKIFSFELADCYGTQIQATCFNEVAEQFYPIIEKGKIYKISKMDVRIANKRFSSIKNDYWLILNAHSNVQLSENQDIDIADVQFDFTSIAEISKTSNYLTTDVYGIVYEDMGTREITTK